MVRIRVANSCGKWSLRHRTISDGRVLYCALVYQLLFYTLLTHNDDVAVHEATLSLKALYFSFHSPFLFSIRPGE